MKCLFNFKITQPKINCERCFVHGTRTILSDTMFVTSEYIIIKFIFKKLKLGRVKNILEKFLLPFFKNNFSLTHISNQNETFLFLKTIRLG